MKTMIKKSLALFLAALILVSAGAAGITALAADSTEIVGTLGIETKLFRFDEISDTWVETNKAKRGENLKARVYVNTDYCTNSGRLMVFYDDAFFVDSYLRDEIIEVEANPYYRDTCSMTNQLAFYSKNGNAIQRMLEEELFTEEFAMTHTCIGIMYMYGINAYNEKLNGEEWLVEFDLTVREDTELTDGSVFTIESIICSPDNIRAFADVPYGRAGERIEHTDPLYSVYVDMYIESNPVSLNTNVILDANGGYFDGETIETVHHITTEIGTDVDLYAAPIPHNEGFRFIGWSFLKYEPDIINTPLITAEYDEVTLYAQWEEEPYIYEVILDANGGKFDDGTSMLFMNYPAGAEILVPAVPSREGFKFNGWIDEYGNIVEIFVMPESDIVLHADWEAVTTYTVTFWLDEDGTELYLEDTYPEGYALVYPAPPTIPGYTFESWSEVEGTEITGNLDVYPTYTANEYSVTVYGLYGDVFDEWIAFYGDTITIDDLFGKDDMDAMLADNGDYYTFDGWSYNGTAITENTVITVTDDVKIEGTFTAMDAKLIFDASGATFANGESTYVVTLKYDDIITEGMYPEIPEYEGHKFKIWSLDLVGQPMDELEKTISISWEKNEYPINYIVDGNVYTTVFAKYGTAVDATVRPEEYDIPAGYTFLGWSLDQNASAPDDLGKVGSNEVNVYAVLEPQQGINYIVEIYKEDFDGNYILENTLTFADGETGKTAPFVADEHVEGFTFNYELSVIDVPVAGDGSTVLLVYYDRNTYELLTYTDDGIFSEQEYLYGEEIDFIYPPQKEGYTFDRWIFRETGAEVLFPLTMPADTLELEAAWVVNDYDVIFDASGGMFDDGRTVITDYLEFGMPVVEPVPPTRDGYTFIGWSEPVPETMPAESITLVALWEAKTYTLHFANTGDCVIESITLRYGDAVPYIAEPYREGHVFTGWMPELPHIIPDLGDNGAEITFDANWRLEQYTFVFNDTGDYAYPDMVVEYGESFELPFTLEKTGYSFDGWDHIIPAVIPDMGDDGSIIEFTAMWRTNKYTVHFDTKHEEPLVPVTYEFGEVVELPTVTRMGYIFAGWHLDGQQIDCLHMPAQDVTLVAEWIAADDTPYTANIYYMNVDGETYTVESHTYYGTTGEEASVYWTDVEGFTFDSEKSVTSGYIAPDGSTVLSLYFNRNQYDFITYADGEVFAEYSYFYGETIVDTDPPVKTGHTFVNWVDMATGEEFIFPFTMPTEDVKLEAVWKVNSYTVSFNTDGGAEIEPMNVAFGNEFILPTAEKTGYSFAFWRGPDGTAYSAGQKVAMPADNMEFRAVWLLQSRKVTFIIGNDTISFDVIPGQKIPMPDMSAYENVEILYWLDNNGKKTEIPDIMPESNLTFTAKLRYTCSGNPYGVTASFESGCFGYEGDELRLVVEKVDGSKEPGGIYFGKENYKQIAFYNIKFYRGNEVVQPENGYKVQISIPVPVAYENSTSFMIVNRFENGEYENFSVSKNGNALVFTVTNFGEFEILVKSETTIKTKPSTTAYIYKQALDLAGLTLEVLDENGNKTIISDTSLMTVNGYNPKKIGTQTLTVEYDGTSAQFDVTVKYAWWQIIIRILLLGFLWY